MTQSIGKYLVATEVAAPKRKTRIFDVYPKDTTLHHPRLGEVKWYAPWRQYAFYPDPNMVFEKQCLRDLADFCEQLMAERKKK